MKETELSQREYLKALRNAHPMDRFDTTKRVANAIGRLTAQRLNKSEAMADALRSNKTTRAGSIWHNTANEVAKKFAARAAKIASFTLKSEETIKSGLGGSRADLFIRSIKGAIAEIDWKTTGKSARKSDGQMKRHASQLEEKGEKLAVQKSRSWKDFIREGAPKLAKYLGGAISGASKKAPQAGTGKSNSSSSGLNTFKRGADSRAVAEWTGKASTKVQRASKAAGQQVPEKVTPPAKAATGSKSAASSLNSRSGRSLGSSTSTSKSASGAPDLGASAASNAASKPSSSGQNPISKPHSGISSEPGSL